MRGGFPRLTITMALAGAMALVVLGHPAEVRAQTVFCPANVLGLTPPVTTNDGTCTNGLTGSFSGAVLASQALSELSQTTTQETAKNTVNSISERREQEEQRCAEGFLRVDGTCERNPPPVAEAAPAVSPAPIPSEERALKKTKKAKIVAIPRKQPPALTPQIVRRAPQPAPAPLPIEPAVRFGTWTQVYGDYEKRNANGPAFISCCRVLGPPTPPPVPLDLSAQSRTGTVGFQAGGDLTSRGVLYPNDGLIAGAMAGYVTSDLTLNSASVSRSLSTVNNVKNEFAHLNANLAGPTAGLYATYFNGGFSTDFLLKVDVVRLRETFNDSLAFCVCFEGLGLSSRVPFAGSGSVGLVNATVASNLNYRFDLYPNFWIEPTVGAQYTNLSYGAGAAKLGLDDGTLVMVQGGARFGTTALIYNHIHVTTTLTGLAYDDVLVAGGFIPGAGFAGNNILRQADQGQVRGRGVVAFNFDFGQGISSFIQGEARGGKGLFGAGGKAGVRYEW